MPELATRIEREQGRRLTADEIFAIPQAREVALSRLLMTYIITGLAFMLLPGTFLGVWNLLSISSRHAAASIPAAWIQAHGHAQIFGWIGSFILGIGFYSIPKLRRAPTFSLLIPWLVWALWTTGVTARWLSTVYEWHWRALLPLSAALELIAFLIFFKVVSAHRPEDAGKSRFDPWVVVVMAATIGFAADLVVGLAASMYVALRAATPAFPADFDQRYLVLSTWGCLVPFVWGFSARWLPVFLGLRATNERRLLAALAVNFAGVGLALGGWIKPAVVVLLVGIVIAIISLRLWEPRQQPAKTKGVHPSFPFFVRLAYAWALISALLAIWAANASDPLGIWGASRHALTVGFLGMMVFCVGQRILPAFSGMRLLFSPRLMFLSLLLLAVGCLLRVSSEILAYQEIAAWAWPWLSVSAVTEMTAVSLFALNLLLSFAGRPTGMQPV